MELNVLLLPLLGGYFFYLTFHGTQYYARRCSGQRLLFNSAIVGVALLVIARLAALSIEKLDGGRSLTANRLAIGLIGLTSFTLIALSYLGYCFVRDKSLGERTADDAAKTLLGGVIGCGLLYVSFHVTSIAAFDCESFLKVAGLTAALFALLWPCVILLEGHTRAPRESLIFRIALLATAAALAFVAAVGYQHQIRDLWGEFSPYSQSGTALFAFVLGVAIVMPLNRLLFPYDVAIDRLYMDSKINSFDRLIYESMIEHAQVQITLKDGKVYVGWVQDMPPKLHENDTYLEILPVSSGYREVVTKKYVPTTYYGTVYQQYVENPDESGIDLKDFTKVIPIAEITIAGKFRDDAYLKFLKQGELAVSTPLDATPTDPDAAPDATGQG